MNETNWENTLKDLRHRLDLIQIRAHEDSTRFQELCRQAEHIKVQFLAHQLESRREHLARSRGIASFATPKESLPLLGVSGVLSILTGIITKDGHVAMNVGIGGLSSSLQGLGETEWAVCLGKHLAVASQDHITQGDVWVTWGSLQTALHELEERVKSGTPLGGLDNIIAELKKSKKLLFVI